MLQLIPRLERQTSITLSIFQKLALPNVPFLPFSGHYGQLLRINRQS